MGSGGDGRTVRARFDRGVFSLIVGALLAASCAAGPRPGEQVSPPVTDAAPRASSAPPPTAIVPIEPGDEPDDARPLASARPPGPPPKLPTGACRPMAFVPGECDPRPHDDAFLDAEEVNAWFQKRGAKRPSDPAGSSAGGGCFVLPAAEGASGAGSEEAMVCASTRIESKGARMTGLSVYRRVDRVRAHVVRGRAVVGVLDAPLLFDAMDKEELTDGPFFSLRVVRDASGKPVVREPSEGACNRARAHNAETRAQAGEDIVMRNWARFDQGLIERLCRAAQVPAAPTAKPDQAGNRSSF